jgi:hypothetical protein
MERHFALALALSDLCRHIVDTESLINQSRDAETRQQNEQLLSGLLKKYAGVMEELRDLLIAGHERSQKIPSPKLRGRERFNTHTRVRMELVFSKEKRAEAERLLHLLSTERERFAALRLSGGDLEKLKKAIDLGRADFRDLLMEAGFANHHEQHQRWWPGQQMSFPPP